MASDGIEMNEAGIDRALADPLTLGRAASVLLTLPAGAPAGTVLATLRTTRYAVYGGLVLSTVGTVPAQVALVGNQIVKTGAAATVGATYPLTIQATGLNGGPVDQTTFGIKATAANSTGTVIAPTPSPTPSPTPTPTPTPTAYIVLATGQSNTPGRGEIDPALDTEQANIIQFCDIPSRTSTYRKTRTSVLPLYHPENRVSDGLLSPLNYAAKAIAATIAAGDVVCIVPAAWGGTSLLNAASNSAPNAPQWSVGRSLHENAIAHTNAAIDALKAAGYNVVVHSIHNIQGEADNGAVTGTDYANALTAAINDMRARITGGANAKVILGGFLPEKLATLPSLQEIEDARKSVAASLANVRFVRGPSGYRLSDGLDVHYNAAGSRVLGRNMGMAATGTALSPTVTFLSDVTAAEGTGAAGATTAFTVQVRRSTYTGAVAVPVSVALGTATADDFAGGVVPSGLTANFADGSDAATTVVNVSADSLSEGAESFTLTLSPPAGYLIGAKGSASVIITNDDASGTPTYLNATFTATDGTGLSGYTSESGDMFSGSSGYVINGGETYSTGSGTSLATSSWIPSSAAYGTRAVLAVKSITGNTYVRWRVQDASNYYFAGVFGGNAYGVYKMVNGTTSSLGTVTQPAGGIVAGSQPVMEIRHAADGTLNVSIDGTTILGGVTDSTFTSGGVGLRQTNALTATTGTHVTSLGTFAL